MGWELIATVGLLKNGIVVRLLSVGNVKHGSGIIGKMAHRVRETVVSDVARIGKFMNPYLRNLCAPVSKKYNYGVTEITSLIYYARSLFPALSIFVLLSLFMFPINATIARKIRRIYYNR